MYPQDNIFNIYYNIGRIVPFQVKRADRGFQALPENLYKPTGRTFMGEKVEPKGKYGKAYGYCLVDNVRSDEYLKIYNPDYKIEDIAEIPCAGCGAWVLVDVPGHSLDEIFPIHKAEEILQFGKYKGKSLGDIYTTDYQYLYWLETTDRFFKIDFEGLKQLYPNVEKYSDISISERIIGFGKYKGKKFNEIKDDISYLEWLVSIGKISNDDFNSLTVI